MKQPTNDGDSSKEKKDQTENKTEGSTSGDGGDKSTQETNGEENDDNDVAPPEPGHLKLEDLVVESKILNYEKFKNFYKKEDVGHIIQALTGPVNLHSQILKEKQRRKDRATNGKEDSGQNNNTEVLHRVRIHSPCILKHLYRAAGKVSDLTQPMRPQTFCRPFKLLVHYHSEMKKELDALERRHQKAAKTEVAGRATSAKGIAKAGDDDNADAKASTNYLYSHYALLHMREYIRFMDKEVIPSSVKFQTKEHRVGQSNKVTFTDLWYLYQEGDTVYSPVPTGKGRSSGSMTATNGSSDLEASYQTCWMVYAVITPETPADPDSVDIRQPRDNDGIGGSDSDAFDDEMTTRICCYYIDFDGDSYGPVTHQFLVRSYSGERDVTTLPVYPTQFMGKDPERKFLEERTRNGTDFTKFVEMEHLYHSGWTLTRSPVGAVLDDNSRYPQHIESEVIVDFNEAFQSMPSWEPEFHVPKLVQEASWRYDSCSNESILALRWYKSQKDFIHACIVLHRSDNIGHIRRNKYLEKDTFLTALRKYEHHGYRNASADADVVPTGDYLRLLPRRLVVFALLERKFINACMSSLTDIKLQEGIFDKLSIDHRHKSMVRSLVHEHFRKKSHRDQCKDVIYQDLVRGKGTGLVFLLHGVPGVGKTATAEAVAQECKRPLFAITCGDLGFEPGAVEKSLTRIFRLANKWDCILLLDEADIFFEKRSVSDLKRNALVSVFLRILEYYSGILFLTTNRVGQLDEAFTSRIHVSLGYSSLNDCQYIDVFKINIEKIEEMESRNEETVKLQVNKADILNWASNHFRGNREYVGRWNGRQIRNAFVIASSLAHYDMLQSEKNGKHVAISGSRPGVLDGTHFEYVAKTTQAFDKYLADTRGKHAGDLAADDGNRGDMSVFNPVLNSEASVSNAHSLGNQINGNGQVGHNPQSPSPGFGYQQDSRSWQQQPPQQWQGHGYPHDGPAMAPSYAQQYGRPPPGSDYPSPAVSSEPPVPSWRKQPQEGPPPVTDEGPVPSWRKQQPPAQSLPPYGHDTPPPGIVRQGSYLGHGPSPPGPGTGYGGYDGGGYQQRPMMSQSGHAGNY